MAPKKKAGKKAANDDWESELGETLDPIASATQAAKGQDEAKDAVEEEDAMGGGGGLLAALKKNKSKKAKKGKVVEDFVEGEDPPGTDGVNGTGDGGEDALAAKAPEEATFDDEDVFAGIAGKKGKGGKGAGGKQAQLKEEEETGSLAGDREDEDGGGKLKSKKEKEKEKKEREKQRKKEQVGLVRLGC